MDYRAVAELFVDWFLKQPMDVTMNADMQCRLIERLHLECKSDEALFATCPTPSLTDDRKYAPNKRLYISRIIEQGSAERGRLSRVHPEANLLRPAASTDQIDVVATD